MVVVNSLEKAHNIEDAHIWWHDSNRFDDIKDSVSWLEGRSSASEVILAINVAFDRSNSNN